VTEQVLHGGVANRGAVVRIGDHVLRPSNPHSPSIHRWLRFLHESGFDGAPLPIAMEDDGRERLTYIEGDVALPPYPAWAQTDTALASIARLMRRFHDASRPFDPSGSTWSDEIADPVGGTVVGHNDVCLENVVFRDGVAVTFLDFDFAAPGRPEYDLAQLARMCVPIEPPVDAAKIGWHPVDRPARLRIVADAYGLDAAGRQLLFDALLDTADVAREFVLRRVEAGDPNFAMMYEFFGGAERYDRRRQFWADHKEEFAQALAASPQ
jgi:hypothetical protein